MQLDASCPVFLASPDVLPRDHVREGTDVKTWSSNPPPSGDHYVPTLTDFAKAHVGRGTENICAAGRDFQ